MRDITAEEIKFWDEHNDERNDARYRSIRDCDEITSGLDGRQDRTENALSAIKADQASAKKLLYGIFVELLFLILHLVVGGA